MTEEKQLITEIETFCKRHKMPLSTFGRRALGNSAFVSNLRGGTSPTLKTVRKLSNFMQTENIKLLTEIETFCKRHKMSLSTFGRRALGNSAFVSSLRGGISPTLRTVRKLSNFMKTENIKLRGKRNEPV